MAENPPARTQTIQSLERGLAVLAVFSAEHPALTLSEVARLTGLTRATARRILLTLESLGMVRSQGRAFSLTPRVLTLGWSYLASLGLWQVAQPLMEELTEVVDESCSAATLDLPDVVYVARVPTRRIMSINLQVGTRLPAATTSMGRVLLAAAEPAERAAFIRDAPLVAHTPHTITDRTALADELDRVAAQGWALVDEELEVGLRSIAAPLTGAGGRTVAALNVSAAAARVSAEEVVQRLLPRLLSTASEISAALTAHQSGSPPRR